MKQERGQMWLSVVGVLAVLVVIYVLFSIAIIPAGHVGVVTRFGAVDRVIYPGLNWRTPLIESVHKMDVRTQKNQLDVGAASSNLQVVTATIAVNYHLDGAFAADVYQNVGKNYDDILVDPAIQNIFKATTAKFTAEELITNRGEVRAQAEEALAMQLADYHVIVENFNIVNFDFSPEFNAAIEAAQVAQQEVERARQQLARAQVEAQTAVAQAQGQADAQAALADSGGLTPEYLQYLALTKWDGHLPNVVGGAIPFIDISIAGPR